MVNSFGLYSEIDQEFINKIIESKVQSEATSVVSGQLAFIIVAIILIIWFCILLKKAIKLNAIHGSKDKLIAALLFIFTGIIGAIIFLHFKISKKLSKSKKKK